jgi:hypothetical protein
MHITRSADVEFAERVGGRATAGQARTRIKILHQAGPDDPPGFEMVIARYPRPREYPVHRHSIDQVRLTLRGSSPWVEGRATPEGGVLYVPAGTPYGPYTRPAGIELMQVQFQGLAEFPFGGEAASQDGPYPAPRVTMPIEIDPSAVGWTVVGPGVVRRDLLVFGQGAVRLAMIRIGDGSDRPLAVDQRTLVFVTSGSGRANGRGLVVHDAVRLEPGESVGLAGSPSIELFVLGLARLAD